MKIYIIILSIFVSVNLIYAQSRNIPQQRDLKELSASSFVNAADFGFSPEASGMSNAKALQQAVDHGGTIVISCQGIYKIAKTVYIGSNTSLIFGNNIYLKKVDDENIFSNALINKLDGTLMSGAKTTAFSHVFVNKGALTKTYDENITIEGLNIIVNGMDVRRFKDAYGLHGQLAFFYVKNLKINCFRCLDLGKWQYGIQVCTFEDIVINDVIIKGYKDGVHLGRGKRFKISNCIFRTFDDAIALNGHDYAVGNPELGWIEDGIVEHCYDLNQENTTGYFCRILAGGWIDWRSGMDVQQSDAVVSNGRIYRVQNKPDGTIYKSVNRPTHESGTKQLDGINWCMVQTDVTYTAGVRNVVFRDIFLEKPRTAFSVHFDNDKYSRSYYPGAEIPVQEQLAFENIRVLYDKKIDFLSIGTPVDVLTISNSSFRNNRINFHGANIADSLKTIINIYGCVFNTKGEMDLVVNSVNNKEILLKTSSNIELHDDFSAKVIPGNGKIIVDSDLTGLKK